MNIRTALERLSRGVVLHKRLPLEFGGLDLYVSPDASLRYWKPGLERTDPWLLNVVSELVQPGMQVWDIGANVGLFGLPCAFKAGPDGSVVLVEADPFLASLCQRSAHAAADSGVRIDVVCTAVASKHDLLSFVVAQRGRASNHLAGFGSNQSGGGRMTFTTVSVTLDWMAEKFPAPDLVKIDVEGAEYEVLLGAHKLLSEVRPTLVVEVGESNRNRMALLLREYAYELSDAELPAAERRLLSECCFNTLAVPKPVVSI
jgi:FkbM family methyltransferase